MFGGRDNLHSRVVAWMKIILPRAALGLLSTLFLISRTVDPTQQPPISQIDLEQRALYQAERLKAFIAQSQQDYRNDPRPETRRLMLIRDAADLETLIDARTRGENVVGALIALEGAHWIGDQQPDIEAGVSALADAGFRMLAPTHRFNNALSGAGEGCDQLAGLTEAGRAFLRKAHASDMILDLAHASDSGIAEAAATAEGPLVISHTGVRKNCDNLDRCVIERNMRDEDIQAIARTGGVVAIGYWPEAVGLGMRHVVEGFRNARRALSAPAFVAEMKARDGHYDPLDHISLGSDYDGAVQVPFDTAGVGYITTALARDGFSEAAVRKIAGGNACRVFATRLPGRSDAMARRICAPYLGAP